MWENFLMKDKNKPFYDIDNNFYHIWYWIRAGNFLREYCLSQFQYESLLERCVPRDITCEGTLAVYSSIKSQGLVIIIIIPSLLSNFLRLQGNSVLPMISSAHVSTVVMMVTIFGSCGEQFVYIDLDCDVFWLSYIAGHLGKIMIENKVTECLCFSWGLVNWDEQRKQHCLPLIK